MFDIKLLIIIFVCVILSIWNPLKVLGIEGFQSYPFPYQYPFRTGWGFGSFINMPTRFTKNQSYDLRGDPFIIPPNPYLSPWGMSSYF